MSIVICPNCGKAKSKRGVLCQRCNRIKLNQKFNSVDERFWAKVHKTDVCWEWQSAIDGRGYGTININGHKEKAHRYSYRTLVGSIPDGMLVCHKCDNRKCVRPDHLFLGTAYDNSRDMITKGRARHVAGEHNPNAKLTEQDVRDIRNSPLSASEIATHYNVASAYVYRIRLYRVWRDI